MKGKKILVTLLCLSLVVGIVGCKKKATDLEPDPAIEDSIKNAETDNDLVVGAEELEGATTNTEEPQDIVEDVVLENTLANPQDTESKLDTVDKKEVVIDDNKTILADTDNVEIELLGVSSTVLGTQLNLKVYNKCQFPITLQCDTVTVGSKTSKTICNITVDGEFKEEDVLVLMAEDGVKDIKGLKADIKICDAIAYDVIETVSINY